MATTDDRAPNQGPASAAGRQDPRGNNNVIRLFDEHASPPPLPAEIDDLQDQIAQLRRQALKEIDAAISSIATLYGTVAAGAGADGVAALQFARRVLLRLDVNDPEFPSRLNHLAIQLDLLAQCLWQVVKSQRAALKDTTV